MSKTDGSTRAVICLSICTLITLTLGAAVAFLELTRRDKFFILETQIERLIEETIELRTRILQCDNTTEYLSKQLSQVHNTISSIPASRDNQQYDYDNYYDDDSQADYDDYPNKNPVTPPKHNVNRERRLNETENRQKRSVTPTPANSPGSRWNLILTKMDKKDDTFKASDVQAQIVIDADDKYLENKQPPVVHVYPSRKYNKDLEERDSRTMTTQDPRTGKSYKTTKTPKYHEQRQPAESVVKHHSKDYELIDSSVEQLTYDPVAVHYESDISEVKRIRPTHYAGNHWMSHPGGYFKDWKLAPWVKTNRGFSLEDGVLTVGHASGLYYLYSQIFYAGYPDTSGYMIHIKRDGLRHSEVLLQCTTTTLTHNCHSLCNTTNSLKKNSCYTGGLVHLQSGDKLWLKEIEGERWTLFDPAKSFFGLFRVANF